MDENPNSWPTGKILAIIPFFLAALGALVFVLKGTNPWAWPSLDMATYYVNLGNENFVKNDFLTSCFGDSNGRALFGKLTSFPVILGAGWYETLYFWMFVNSAAMPAAVYLCLCAVMPVQTVFNRLTVFCFVLFAILLPGTVHKLTVGWWSSWDTFFHPSVFSITALFYGVYLVLEAAGNNVKIMSGAALVFLSYLLHPAYALGGCIFLALIIVMRKKGGIRDILPIFIPAVAAVASIRLYSSSGSLDAQAYYRYFSLLHPEHYIPTRFVALGDFHWAAPVVLVTVLCLLAATGLLLLRHWREAIVAFSLLVFYSASLAAQYYFVEINPSVKEVILVSPGRFLAYGYWIIAVVAAMSVSAAIYKFVSGSRSSVMAVSTPGRFVHEILAVSNAEKFLPYVRFFLAATILCVLYLGFHGLRQPMDMLSHDDRQVIEWINENTASTDILASPASSFLKVSIPILTGRGSYSGNGFPFEDGCIEENYARYINIYGDPTGPRGRLDAGRNYDALGVDRFSMIKPTTDFAILNKSSAGAGRSRDKMVPVFENNRYIIFKIT